MPYVTSAPQTQRARAVSGGDDPVTLPAEESSSLVKQMQPPVAFRLGYITFFPVLKGGFHLHSSSGG